MQDLDKDEMYTVWLDGSTRLFQATGEEIQKMKWDGSVIYRLKFSHASWANKVGDRFNEINQQMTTTGDTNGN